MRGTPTGPCARPGRGHWTAGALGGLPPSIGPTRRKSGSSVPYVSVLFPAEQGGASMATQKIDPRKADSTDVEVGRLVRALRMSRGLTQTDLANRIGVTFQQVQKYEVGTNRISIGR